MRRWGGGGGGGGGVEMPSRPYTRREYFIHSPGVYGAPYTPVVSSLSAHTLLAMPWASVVQYTLSSSSNLIE